MSYSYCLNITLDTQSLYHNILQEEEEEEEIYLAQTQQIKCKYKSYTIQLSRVTGKPEGQLCRPP